MNSKGKRATMSSCPSPREKRGFFSNHPAQHGIPHKKALLLFRLDNWTFRGFSFCFRKLRLSKGYLDRYGQLGQVG